NVDMAEQRIELADEALDAARAVLAPGGGDQSAVVGPIRTPQAALQQAAQLLDRVDRGRSGIRRGITDPPDHVGAAEDGLADAGPDERRAQIAERVAERKRKRGLLARSLTAAEARVSAAADFIATRRGGIGSQARVRLSEAERHLAQAREQSGTDHSAALDAA